VEDSIFGNSATKGWKPRAVFALSLLLAGGLLILALRGVSWHDMRTAIQQGKPGLLVLAALILSLSYFTRSLRWELLIRASKRIGIGMAFWTTMVGYVANSFLPARAGDMLRPIVTGRVTRSSTGHAFAAQITERITDTLMLVVLSLIASISLRGIAGWLSGATWIMGTLGFAGTIVMVFAPRMEGFFQKILFRLPLPDGIRDRASGLLSRFLVGMRVLHEPKRAALFFGLTAIIWLLDDLTAVVVARALRVSLSWQQAMVLLVALGLASAVPSTPGSVGIFQFVAVTVLIPFGLTRSEALAYIVEFQAVIYAVVIVWGSVAIWQLSAAHYLSRASGTRRVTDEPKHLSA
jgi:glycosyltransferase 2 family protein